MSEAKKRHSSFGAAVGLGDMIALRSWPLALLLLACSRPPSEVPNEVQKVQEAPAASSVSVVLLGDSLARGTGDETGVGFDAILKKELRLLGMGMAGASNLGMDGARTGHLLAQVQKRQVRDQVAEADVLIVSIGANDLFVDSQVQRGVAAQAVADGVLQRLDLILDRLHRINPRAQIFLIGLYNPFLESSFGRAARTFIEGWNAELRTRYRDRATLIPTLDLLDRPEMFSLDGFHPSAEGYRRIAERLADEMARTK